MKTHVRSTPRVLMNFAGLFAALFLLTSTAIILHTNVASAQTRNFNQRLVKLRSDINRLIEKGTYVPALIKAKFYVRLMAKKVGTRHPSYARALQLQAKIYRYLKRPVEARKFELRAALILKNHRNFKAKRDANIKAAIAASVAKRRAMELRLRKQRVQQRAKLQGRVQEQRQPSSSKRTQKKRRLRTVKKQKKAAPQPRSSAQMQKPVAKSKPIPDYKFNLNPPTTSGRTYGAAKPHSSYQPTRRTSRSTRGQQKPVMRSKSAASRSAPQGGEVSKATAPPPSMTAPPAPPVIASRTLNKGPTGGAVPQTEAGAEPPAANEPAPAASLGKKNHTIVKVYYATDRQRTSSKQLASIYSGEPADPIRISYGICEVSIPKGHKPGQLEAPSIYRFEFKEDPDKHVVLLNVHPQEKKSYFRNLKDVIARSKGENAFIFIHGYNVTFSDAARRTAQISYDLGFDGAPVFYSWPSTGELSGYPADEDNILWAQENIKQFLRDFVEQTDAKNIYLVAHSMGSRALTGAVASLISEAPKFKKRFKEIILAAPDISARIFKDHIAPKMLEASNNVTLYVSADDKALLASRNFHSNPRAGEAGENIIIFKGIDTIDATGIDASLLAHSYFAEAKSIISDILAIIRGKPPQGRKTLKPIETKRGIYWAFRK